VRKSWNEMSWALDGKNEGSEGQAMSFDTIFGSKGMQ